MTKDEWYTSNDKPLKWRKLAGKLVSEFKKVNGYASNERLVIHHIDDREDAVKYNNEHYEMWGFNEDGTFEYGKYVVFMTVGEHSSHHMTGKQRFGERNSFYGRHHTEETRQKIKDYHIGLHASEETKKKMSESRTGEKNSFYGKHHTDATKKAISIKNKANLVGEKNPMYGKRGELAPCYGRCGELHPMYGLHHTEESLHKISAGSKRYNDWLKVLYTVYKKYSGIMKWNAFKTAVSTGDISFEYRQPSVYISGV